MSKKEKIVSINYVKHNFETIGLILCLYILLVLYIPLVLTAYFESVPGFSLVINNDYLYIGIIYLLFVIGSLVPTLLLFSSTKVRFEDVWRKCNITFKDLAVNTIVFIALGTATMFLTMVINSYLPLGEKIVSPVGLPFEQRYLLNPLYGFLFIIVSPIVEEFAFRGVLLRSLGRYGNLFAIWTIALFYALSHASFAEMIPSFVMSVFLTKMTLRYRSIQPSIVIHIIFNAILYAFAITPLNYYWVVATILFALYFLTIVFIFTKTYRYVHIGKTVHDRTIWQLFLSRPSIICALSLVILHSLFMAIF